MVADFVAPGWPYPFDNAAPQAGERFGRLAELYDGVTQRHLDRLGINDGWHCLEVGAGGGSIARFMSDRVGCTGHVLATDINTDWMAGSMPANVEVRRHDIGVDPLDERAFDIVHARAVLVFVSDCEPALTRMITALKPGGWLVVEELVAEIVETGLMSSSELDRYRAALNRPDCLDPASMALISVWGRRPLS